MRFPRAEVFTRLRAGLLTDPYDPETVIGMDWAHPDELEVYGFFASQQSLEQSDPVRAQIITTKQLVLESPDADVQAGDRIRKGDQTWSVTGEPAADINPWSGWRPSRVVNLENVTG
ncbi:hypothetical protein [Pseudoclavibacter sp. CFCC 13611]|uniref:hypothetical protein n=1 Tax=Pseudoclavibacter sp. CFCC 13611 TaxID=2615178 RepID=UPI00130195C5|nr:hypothetical protein [Pseudoclavibacter sp. CFCC 13611]KAB1662822.1 hypothetical protein F8O08_09665 [Pseudoclavibacter sp. CFCC 13611]